MNEVCQPDLAEVKWNLRLAAANRGIWKAGDLQRLLAEHGLAISAAKKTGAIFRNPTIGLKVGDRVSFLPLPQPEHRIEAAAQASFSSVERLALILAALHAARAGQIRPIRLDDVDPHLIINQISAVKTTPVSTLPFRQLLRGRDAATLQHLRVDRQLEEVLASGADPLHLAALFGLDEKTSIRYATTARQLLETDVERHDR